MTQLRHHIERYEQISRRLEPSAEERARLTAKVTGYADSFLDAIYDAPVYVASEDRPLSETRRLRCH